MLLSPSLHHGVLIDVDIKNLHYTDYDVLHLLLQNQTRHMLAGVQDLLELHLDRVE